MRAIVNDQQDQAWNGDEGRHWADHHDRWNAVNGEFNEPLLSAAAIAPGERVLDIGCGAGQTTRLAARHSRTGDVLGLDLSAPELERARELAAREHLANARFERGDAQVHPLPADGFDVAISRFGIMFFADPVAAFANIARALRPGGRLALLSLADPDRVDWVRVFAALRPFGPVPDFAIGEPGMFSLADPMTFRQILTDAGFTQVETTLVEAPMTFGRDADDAANFLLGSGPIRSLLSRSDAATADRVRFAMAEALRPFEQSGGVRLGGAAWLATATRPRS
ncbi:SAM-dependent methyltransferase [Streptomyces tateyamensis]|uniref:SAM-dependent methyltransferase n=1 Tax=Streptomyces tateyamensis TaxID=565073 RepID=A0A2V4P0X3_9ACTN|nr:class I SAM-dependent methyltransferase [Streptomyces tateyamensis]PYC83205.1 SAM-dependent methyltransferase [Streptomyces tateyamensis]